MARPPTPAGPSGSSGAAPGPEPPPDPPACEPLHTFEGHTDFSTCVALSPGAVCDPSSLGRVLSTGDDRTVRLWSFSHKSHSETVLARCTDGGWHCALSADGRVAAAACNDGAVRVWRLDGSSPSASAPLVLRQPGNDVAFGVGLSASGSILYATFFCAETARGVLARYRLPSKRPARTWPHDMYWGRASVRVSRCGSLVALATDVAFLLLDGSTGARKLLRKVPVSEYDLALAADAGRVVAATVEFLRVYSTKSGNDFDLHGYRHPLSPSVDISSDGRVIVAAQRGYAFAVWRGRSRVPVLALAGSAGLMRGCAISADGSIVAGASVDKHVRVWVIGPSGTESPPAFQPLSPRPRAKSSRRAKSRPRPTSAGQPAEPTSDAGGRAGPGSPKAKVPRTDDEPPLRLNGTAADETRIPQRTRRATESNAQRPARNSRHSLQEEGSGPPGGTDEARRHSESVLDRRRANENGSRLVSAISALAKMGFESLGYKR